MNDEHLPEDTVSRNAWIDAVCDRFEAEWRASRSRPIPEFLKSEGIDPESAHSDLLAELAKLEEVYEVTSQHSYSATSSNEADVANADFHSSDGIPSEAEGDAHGANLPKIPGYRVIREIARGGMGIVYLAYEPSFQREVAVKVLNNRYVGDVRAYKRFLSEARLTGRLQHPGIPPVFEVGKLADRSPFLAMKLIEGKTLKEVMAERSITQGSLLLTFEQICQAVAFAHNLGIIHRDLKPANVMVGAFGEVQVMDWGLAKVLNRPQADSDNADIPEFFEENPDPTRVGMIVGTPQYMAPEQARGEVLDRRADVFGLGAILCEILTGQPPFVGQTPREIIDQAAAANFGPLFSRLNECGSDTDLISLCLRCLDPLPQSRPGDAGELAKFVADLRVAAERRLKEAELDRATEKARAVEEIRRRKVLLALAVVLLVGITATSSFAYYAFSESVRANGANQKTGDALAQLTEAKAGTDAALIAAMDAKAETDSAMVELRKAKETTEDALANLRIEKTKTEQALAQSEKRLSQLGTSNDLMSSILVDIDPYAEIKEGKPLRAVIAARLANMSERLDGEAIGDRLVVAKMQKSLGLSNLSLRYPERAVVLLRKAHTTYSKLLGPRDKESLTCLDALCVALLSVESASIEIQFFEEAFKLTAAILGPKNEATIKMQSNLATAYGQIGEYGKAVSGFEQVIEYYRIKGQEYLPQLWSTLNGLAIVHHKANRHEDSLKILKESTSLILTRYRPIIRIHYSVRTISRSLINKLDNSKRHFDFIT